MLRLSIVALTLALLAGCKGCIDNTSSAEDPLSGAQDLVEPMERDDRPSWAARSQLDLELQDEPDNPVAEADPVEEAPAQPTHRAWAEEAEAEEAEVEEQEQPPLRYVRDEAEDAAFEDEPAEEPLENEDETETPTDLAEEDEPIEPADEPYEDY